MRDVVARAFAESLSGMDKIAMPFLEQNRPESVKKIYRALKRDHPEMSAEMKARIAAKQGKPGKQKKGPPYNGSIKEAAEAGKFAGLTRVPMTRTEESAFASRVRNAGLNPRSVSIAKTQKGFSVYTHRARSPWYPTVEDIPVAKIKWIESTG